jgi:transcriptional regulator with XRE-family HTH domain
METEAMTLDPKTLGFWTRCIRTTLHWSQEALAAEAGVDVRTIQRIEAGGGSSVSTRRQLARALGYENPDVFDDPDFIANVNDILAKTRDAAQAEELKKPFPEHIRITAERIKSGDALGRLADISTAIMPHTDDEIPQEAKEIAASLFDYLRDLMDISDEASFSDKVGFNKELGEILRELDDLGMAVYSAVRHTKVTGKTWQDKTPMPLTIGYVTVVPAEKEIVELVVPRGVSF